MIVVDANVIAYFFIQGEKTKAARELWRRDANWRVPPLWRHEYLNVLATFVREGGAPIADARNLWRQSIELLAVAEQVVDMESALLIATENRISAYDAQYIALARQLETVCVTEDRRLLATFPSLTRAISWGSETT